MTLACLTPRTPIPQQQPIESLANKRPGARSVDAGLPLNETTVADQLKKAGYATAIMGKWCASNQCLSARVTNVNQHCSE